MQTYIEKYAAFKTSLASEFGASQELLHMHAGLAIFFTVALVFRQRMRSWLPIALVYIFAIGNEAIDAIGSGEFNPKDSEPFFDVLNTVFWPTLLFLLARRRARKGA